MYVLNIFTLCALCVNPIYTPSHHIAQHLYCLQLTRGFANKNCCSNTLNASHMHVFHGCSALWSYQTLPASRIWADTRYTYPAVLPCETLKTHLLFETIKVHLATGKLQLECFETLKTFLFCAQVLIVGKISQAVVIAAAAYRTEAQFRERTGIQKSKLIVDEFHTNTHVSLPMPFLHESLLQARCYGLFKTSS